VPILDTKIIVRAPDAAAPAGAAFAPGDVTSGERVGDICARLRARGTGRREVINTLGRYIGAGAVDALWEPHSGELARLLSDSESEEMCRRRPHLWNILCYEREWETHADYNDFLDPSSPVHSRKLFQWEIYERLLKKMFSELGAGSRVLDAGGGPGRASVPLAKRGCEVTLVDSSPRALSTAWKHLAAAGAANYELEWGDAADMYFLADDSFRAAVALEVFCYLDDPRLALSETVRCVEPGGAALQDLLGRKTVIVEGDLYVEYFEPDELEDIAYSAGLEDVRVTGCHYTADGIFHRLAPEKKLSDPARRRRFHAIEKLMRETPGASRLARAWLVTGRVE